MKFFLGAFIFFSGCAVALSSLNTKVFPETLRDKDLSGVFLCNNSGFRLYLDPEIKSIRLEQAGFIRKTVFILTNRGEEPTIVSDDGEILNVFNQQPQLGKGLIYIFFPRVLEQHCCYFRDSSGNLYDRDKIVRIKQDQNATTISLLNSFLIEIGGRVLSDESIQLFLGKRKFFCTQES